MCHGTGSKSRERRWLACGERIVEPAERYPTSPILWFWKQDRRGSGIETEWCWQEMQNKSKNKIIFVSCKNRQTSAGIGFRICRIGIRICRNLCQNLQNPHQKLHYRYQNVQKLYQNLQNRHQNLQESISESGEIGIRICSIGIRMFRIGVRIGKICKHLQTNCNISQKSANFRKKISIKKHRDRLLGTNYCKIKGESMILK